MDLGIRGKKAIVCASSRGIGKGCAVGLAEAGADLVINGRDAASLAATGSEIRERFGVDVVEISGDVSDPKIQKALLAACPEPDILVTTAAYDPDRTCFAPEEVPLVVEVVSPESAHRDRGVKLRKYAEAGIAHYWCIEDEDGAPVVHAYELDGPTATYVPAGIFRGSLRRPVPFRIDLDLDSLTP